MAGRITLEVTSTLVITLLLASIGSALILGGGNPFVAFPEAVAFLLGPTGIAVGLWAVLLIVFSIVLRRRPTWVRSLVHLGSLVVANVVNVGVLLALAGTSADSWFGLVVAIALAAGAGLFAAALVAVALTEFVVLRRRSEPVPA